MKKYMPVFVVLILVGTIFGVLFTITPTARADPIFSNLKLDVQGNAHVTAAGYTEFNWASRMYTVEQGYGWDVSPNGAVDRGAGNGGPYNDDLQRDLQYLLYESGTRMFRINVETDEEYNITIWVGDIGWRGGGHVYIQGVYAGIITAVPSPYYFAYSFSWYEVTSGYGYLNITIIPDIYENVAINGIEIEQRVLETTTSTSESTTVTTTQFTTVTHTSLDSIITTLYSSYSTTSCITSCATSTTTVSTTIVSEVITYSVDESISISVDETIVAATVWSTTTVSDTTTTITSYSTMCTTTTETTDTECTTTTETTETTETECTTTTLTTDTECTSTTLTTTLIEEESAGGGNILTWVAIFLVAVVLIGMKMKW